MPSCCGSGSSCSCKISAGAGIEVSGSGTAVDPFVLSASVGFTVQDNPQFDLTMTGTGTATDPYTLEVQYAATSKLDDIPDVNATGATNGQVLAWNAATSQWVAQNPTTAPTGAVSHDTSLSGDGSVGTPLTVVVDATRFMGKTASGVGLTDPGVNSLVRHFTDSTARAAASPAPALNTLSMLDIDPGRLAYWDGSQWAPLPASFDIAYAGAGTEFLALSGPYGGTRRTHYIKQFSGTTDASGNVDVLDAAVDLLGRGGVLSVMFQETGDLAFKAVLYPNVDRVSAHIYRISDGSPYAAQAFTGMVEAWLY